MLVDSGDDAGLGLALVRLLEDRALSRTLAERAKERVEENFTCSRQAEQYLYLFRRLLAAQPLRASMEVAS